MQTETFIPKPEVPPRYRGGTPPTVEIQREFLTPHLGYTKIMTVDATIGNETIYGSSIFDEVDPDYREFGLSTPSGIRTRRHRVVVGRQAKTGTLLEIFSAVRSLPQRIMQQGQELSFCQKYNDVIPRDGRSVIFPIMIGDQLKEDKSNLFYSNVFCKNGKLKTNVRRFNNDWVLLAEDERLFAFLHI